jgi:hypothetical protein
MAARNTPYTTDDWRRDTANIAKIVEPALEDLWFEIFECEEDFLEHIDPGGIRVSQLRMFSRMFMWYWVSYDSEMETADADDMETMAAMASKVLTEWRAALIQQVAA